MRHYGIIGQPLEHSFSARYFTDKFMRENIDADFRLFPISDIALVTPLLTQLDGFNVTLPYKQAIIPYLSGIDSVAAHIGAVNVVHAQRGYNTDWIGFTQSIQPMLTEKDTHALILGTGGVSRAVTYALRQLGITTLFVSRQARSGSITYADITSDIIQQHTIIVNCTPLGMYPHTQSCPAIPYQLLTSNHLLFDCVYNPEKTLFLQQGEKQGARTQNGLQMLYRQADAAWQIWNSNNN